MHLFTHLLFAPFPLRTVSKGMVNTHNIPTICKVLGQNKRLRKENKSRKNPIKRYLQKTIAEQTQIDNIYNMGNFPLHANEIKVLKVSALCLPQKWF